MQTTSLGRCEKIQENRATYRCEGGYNEVLVGKSRGSKNAKKKLELKIIGILLE